MRINRPHVTVEGLIKEVNPVLRGWVNYFRIGNSSKECLRSFEVIRRCESGNSLDDGGIRWDSDGRSILIPSCSTRWVYITTIASSGREPGDEKLLESRMTENFMYGLRRGAMETRGILSLVRHRSTLPEGSTTQSDAEQGRFLGIAMWSLIETVACLVPTVRQL